MVRLLILSLTAVFLSGCINQSNNEPLNHAVHETSGVQGILHAEPTSLPGKGVNDLNISEPEGQITLADALSLTIMHNPELKVFSYETRSADARRLLAGMGADPELDIEVENFGGENKFNRMDSAMTTIKISQLIEMGDKVKKRQKVASYDFKLAELDYRAKQLDITTDVTKTYVELLYIQQKLALSQELIDISSKIASSVEKRIEAGKDSPLVLSKARLWLANAKIQHIEAAKYHEATRKKLASYWGNQDPEFTTADGQLDDIQQLPDSEQIKRALKDNPEILRRSIEMQKRTAQQFLAKSESLPDINIAGGIKIFNEHDSTAFVIGLSFPLMVSKRNHYKRSQAALNLSKAQFQHEASVIIITNEVNRLHADLKCSYDKIMIYKNEILSDSKQVLEGSKISYEQGRSDYLDLLDSQKTYFTVMDKYIDAMAEYNITKAELQRLIGINPEEIKTLTR